MSIFTGLSFFNYLETFDEEIDRRFFYQYLTENNIDLEKMFLTGKSCDKNQKQHFNNVLRKIKSLHSVNIYEIVGFIEQDFADTHVILNMLDDKNWSIIKKELSKKYKKNVPNEGFSKFFLK